MARNWIRTDEVEDVAGSVRQALRVISIVDEDPQAWKWLILALHSALQGACICHLATTAAPLGALTKQNSIEWVNYLEGSRNGAVLKRPKTHLMNLPELIKAIRKPNSAGSGEYSGGIAISDSELAWLHRFHEEIRNQFVHFKPMGWSIEVSGIPEISKLVARIINEILEFGWAFRHQDIAQREDLKLCLQELAKLK